MEKQEFYKFIGRLVIFIHGLYVLLCSKDIINLDVRKEKLNETEIKEVVSEFDRMNKSVKIRKMK